MREIEQLYGYSMTERLGKFPNNKIFEHLDGQFRGHFFYGILIILFLRVFFLDLKKRVSTVDILVVKPVDKS